ncbi:30S ribosomal protein S17 [Psychrobacter arenosus]|jgi:small subunit ribosomal protein S17|uniref:30S ribosomal protein S17 n=1 Tax=Psychrobacter arenosus TaxID=256326 RepID=UPI00191966BF|nr:30S ribosomal protein S17 [Psychrobacter arenosus]
MSENNQTSQDVGMVTGRVVSNKMDKSITVLVERKVRHPLYGKQLRRSTKIKAHDEDNVCQQGDLVRIKETRPISKTKAWALVDILETAVKI